MATWIPADTPILESVFVDIADYATDISNVFDAGHCTRCDDYLMFAGATFCADCAQ